ncbi:MAG: hypothetical protein EA369_10285 [Bradymonadales bacterium]|nr:MAG: hypothetical protein EA369_10285 [Bradymonadales bacterium]
MIEDGQQWLMLVRALASLALVIGSIFAIAWIAKKYWRPEKWGMNLSGLKIRHQLAFDSKRKLVVIELEGREFLVGMGSDSITSLLDLGEREGARNESSEVRYVERA